MSIRTQIAAASLAAALALSGSAAFAQESHDGHASAPAVDQASPASAAYRAAMDRMHEAMDSIEDTGDADVDFARGMIPHHRAAIDMAKAVLEHGKDPEIRQLAKDVIEAQESEIEQLERWLEENAG
jgi:uncharacterized protein (DUF305 family)